MQQGQRLLSDLALSRRLERAEAAAGARFVEARAKLRSESGACVAFGLGPVRSARWSAHACSPRAARQDPR